MMGMVFTELLDMVEERHSLDVVDKVLARAGARGSYTSVGNYDDAELVAIVVALSEESGVPVPDLLHAYGEHLFGRFYTLFPQFFDVHGDALAFLRGLESHVHTEVRKLYPVAHPPLFSSVERADGGIDLDYRSRRALGVFARGLLEACLRHYGGRHHLAHVEDLSGGAGTHVRFRILPGPRPE
jgi:Haem-NO-binding